MGEATSRSGRIETRIDPPHSHFTGNLDRAQNLVQEAILAKELAPVASPASAPSAHFVAAASPNPTPSLNPLQHSSQFTSQPSSRDEGAWMHQQAQQLAELLQAKQAELDHRQAQLNALAFELDQRDRNIRLWIQMEQRSLSEREENLQRESQLVEREKAQVRWMIAASELGRQ